MFIKRSLTTCLGLLTVSATAALMSPLVVESAALAKAEIKSEAKADLPNFHQVHDFLFRGGEPSTAGVKDLSNQGIKTIIDLRAAGKRTEDEAALAKSLGMRYINLPMSDKAPTEAQVATFVQTVEAGRDCHEPVFVHCAHGSDRTGCMVGIWRVTHDNYSYNDAYKEMRSYFFGPQFKALSGAVKSRANSVAKRQP